MITAGTHGAPNWVDLSTPNVESAIQFYRQLLGWDVERSETPTGPYFIASAEGQQVAGMMQAGPDLEGMPPMWTVFFNVDDVDKMASHVTDAGGSVLEEPFDIPEARIAVVADPTGAMFGLFGGPEIEGTWLTRRTGGACWVETMNRDPATAESFYASIFDWKAESETDEYHTYTTFRLDGYPVAGMMRMPDNLGPEVSAHWGVYFVVDDCEAAVADAVKLGGQVLRPTAAVEFGQFAVLADPQGAVFQVMAF